MLLGLLLSLPDRQAGEPDVGLSTSFLWENLCDTIIFQLWVDLLIGLGFDFIAIAPLSHLVVTSTLSLDVGCLFW